MKLFVLWLFAQEANYLELWFNVYNLLMLNVPHYQIFKSVGTLAPNLLFLLVLFFQAVYFCLGETGARFDRSTD